jgi:hypothetical protein
MVKESPSDGSARNRLRFRETDRFVKETARLPLSVSSDRTAVTAMRCAALLTAHGERRSGPGGSIDRSGDDQVVEVYPGASLVQWSGEGTDTRLDPQGYKDQANLAKRETLLDTLLSTAPWLVIGDAMRLTCVKSDDALDALLCSLITRAASKGLTLRPATMSQTALAHVEGWIHLPTRDSLGQLVNGL